MATAPPYTDRARVLAMVSRDAGPNAGTAGSISDPTIENAIGSAATLIDSRLGVQYSVPFNPVPKLVTDIATALAAYDCDLTFREVRDYQSDLNPILLRQKWATEMLDQLQKGTATLPDYQAPDPDPGPTDGPGGDIVAVFNPDLCAPDLVCGSRRPTWADQYYGWTL
jgi:hypothetical protein